MKSTRLVVISFGAASAALVLLSVVSLVPSVRAARLAAEPAASGGIRGTWTAQPARWKTNRSQATTFVQLQLQIQRETSGGHWNSSFPLPLDELKGLSAAQLEAPQAEARFELSRDAGTLAFEGRFQQGAGAGHFRFAPSSEYLEAMRKMGYQGLDEEKVFSLAVHDVSRTFIRELAGLGYERVALDDLVKMRIHGVTADFIRSIQQKSGRAVSADRLVEMRIHGREP